MRGKLTKLPRAEQWADRICTQLGKTAESMIETGRLLIQAKKELAPGEWGRFFEERLVPFNQRWAEMFMAVARNTLLSNSHHGANLPPALKTLYQLTRADQVKLKNALKDGVITPDMPRKTVAALLPPKATPRNTPRLVSTSAPNGDFAPVTRCYFDIETRLRATIFALNAEEQRDLLDSVQQLLTTLAGEAQRRTA